MKKARAIAVPLLGLVGALAVVGLLPQQTALAQSVVVANGAVVGPLPPVPPPPDLVVLSPTEKLGKFMIFDTTMSNPTGYACVQCHAYTAGFTSGLEPIVNLVAGVPPGVIPGRWDNRKAYTYGYAAFSPEGPYYDATAATWFGGNFWDGRASDTAVQRKAPRSTPTR